MPTSSAETDGLSAPRSLTRESRGTLDGFLFSHRGKLHPAFTLAAVLAAKPTPDGIVVGAVLMLVHLSIRLWAVRHIGGAARVHARKARERKRLVTSGPFALVRNPLYIANIAGLAGTCMVLGPAWLAGLAGVTALIWYALVVRWEEGVLDELYGDQYRAYREQTPALVPSLSRIVRGDLGEASLPLSTVLRRERGLGVIIAVVTAMAVAKQLLA